MNIAPITRQITEFSFRISSEDLERYLADPQAWATDVRAQLNGHTPGAAKPATGGGVGPKDHAGALEHARRPYQRRATKHTSRKPKSSRTPKPNSGRASKSQKTAAPLKCSTCDKPFITAGRLRNHMRDQHGVVSAPVPSTATAASAG